MYWKRNLASALQFAVSDSPAILVTGPRQSGKTTFLRHEAPPGHAYVSLDDAIQRDHARRDPKGFLAEFERGPLLIDEVQYAPDLFSYLKLQIDEEPERCGRFLLTGSQQFQMMRHVSDSLAGRIRLLELLPFSMTEIQRAKLASVQDLLWYGGYPLVATKHRERDGWIESYIQTYVERDARQLLNISDLQGFEDFLGLCAARHGQILNITELARDCGITYPTCRGWLSVLQSSYIMRALRPYHANFGKRLIKSYKIYFTDPAIPAFLTRLPSADALWHGPTGGAFFEGWIVMEAFKFFAARGKRADVYFWRSHDGTEVDLLVEAGGKVFPVEIKQTATPREQHAAPLDRFRAIAGAERCGEAIIVCCVKQATPMGRDVTAIPWQDFPKWLEKIA